LTREMTQNC